MTLCYFINNIYKLNLKIYFIFYRCKVFGKQYQFKLVKFIKYNFTKKRHITILDINH